MEVHKQMFLIMSYGCHLWNLDMCDVKNTLDRGLRKSIRKGLSTKNMSQLLTIGLIPINAF